MVEVDAHTSQLHEAQASTNGLRPRHSTGIRESARGQHFDRIIPGNPALGKVGDAVGPAEKLYEPGRQDSFAISVLNPAANADRAVISRTR